MNEPKDTRVIRTVAIIGASLAGARAAETLRARGFDGRVLLIGEEPWLPYQRPPLSKDYLWPGGDESAILLRPADWYEANRIEARLGVKAERLDLRAREVRLSDGSDVQADAFLLATGSRPRRLPALEGAANVHYLRTRDDAARLAGALTPGARILVVGMGVIGAEVAATATRAGARVVAVEPAPTPMLRSFGSVAGAWLARAHAERGVEAHFGRMPERFEREGGLVRGVTLDGGERFDRDAVVVGIGVEPADELAREAGLDVDNGILVDRRSATSCPFVYAAGDVANQPGFFGGRARLETFHNAAAQAEAAAAAMLGEDVDACQPCSFWSDQYDFNIQSAGRVRDECRAVVRGSVSDGDFTLFYLADDLLEGVVTVNRPADMAVAKRMIPARRAFDPAALADSSVPLRSLLAKPASS